MGRGTNTLTGWDGTELLICADWISLYMCVSLAGKVGHQLLLFSPECLVLLGRIVFTVVVFMVEVCIVIHITAISACGTKAAQLCMTALLSYNKGKLFTLRAALASVKWKCLFKWLGNK